METKIEEAIHFVFVAFKGKRRSKEDIELAYHSISVGMMLMENNMSEEIVLTGLLHDIIEDSEYGYDDIKQKFGEKIAENVLILSENKEIKNFKERKIEFINRLKKISNNDLIMVEIADKLQNLVSDYNLYKVYGKDALKTLETSYEMNKWYYNLMKNLFLNKVESNRLLNRYLEIVNLYFER